MQFSKYGKQLLVGNGTLQLMEDLGTAHASSEPVLMLGGGNPAHIPEVERHFQNTMRTIVNDDRAFGAMMGDYDGPQGHANFIKTLAASLKKKYRWELGPENIALTNGSQHSFSLLFNALAGEYDDGSYRKILLPMTPEYIGYADIVVQSNVAAGNREASVIEARRPTIERLDNGFFKYHIEFESLYLNESYGAVCVSRPTNPTGNVISDQELEKLIICCRDAGIPLIIDSAYGLPFPNLVFCQARPYWNPDIIMCMSLSKLGLPGARTGIIIAQEEIIALVRGANAVNTLAPGSVGATLATALLKDDSLFTLASNTIQPYYKNRMEKAVVLVKEAMDDLPVLIHQPDGALFLWLWFENLPVSCEHLYEMLKQKGVYVLPGRHFFPGIKGEWQHMHECIRINYAGEDLVVERGVNIIADTVRSIYRR